MPLLQLHLAGTWPVATQSALQAGLTRLMAEALGKRAALTVVSVQQTPPAQWSGGGASLPAEAWRASLVAHVTAGTNTPAEQAVFIAEAHRLLVDTLQPPAAAPVYVIVNEVPAHAWGYDGRTQADRRPKPPRQAAAPATLREWAGLPEAVVLRPGDTALLLIDFQREYGADGRLPLPGLGAAAMLAQRLAESFDQRAALVIHVHHVARAAQGVPFASAEPGITPLPVPATAAGHRRLRKSWPSAFQDTELLALLQAAGIRQLVIAGAMTHNCVDSTARAALHLGLDVVVAQDACATRALPGIGGGVIDAEQVHATALAALADRHARVAGVRDLLRAWEKTAAA